MLPYESYERKLVLSTVTTYLKLQILNQLSIAKAKPQLHILFGWQKFLVELFVGRVAFELMTAIGRVITRHQSRILKHILGLIHVRF